MAIEGEGGFLGKIKTFLDSFFMGPPAKSNRVWRVAETGQVQVHSTGALCPNKEKGAIHGG
jgi:hypothetical protein